MSEFRPTITIMSNPTPEHRAEHQRAALRYVTERCETLDGYDEAVARIERNYGTALPDDLKQQSRQRIAARLANTEE